MDRDPDGATGDVTRLLAEWREGRAEAASELFSLVYDQLRRMARAQLGGRRPGETLRPTAVVHELYLKLASLARLGATDRQHFFALAARAMRQVVIDHARRQQAQKRGGQLVHTALDDQGPPVEVPPTDLLALDEALERLTSLDPRAAQVVELRFFAGLSVEETAELLTLSPRTVKREWRKARAFLHDAIGF